MCTSHTRCTTYAFGVACTRRYDVRTQVQGLGDRRRTVHRGSTRGLPNVDRSVSNGRQSGGRCVDIGCRGRGCCRKYEANAGREGVRHDPQQVRRWTLNSDLRDSIVRSI